MFDFVPCSFPSALYLKVEEKRGYYQGGEGTLQRFCYSQECLEKKTNLRHLEGVQGFLIRYDMI